MSEDKQGKMRKLVSGLATIAIVGYIGSYTPSLLGWWEQTWYPHGREARVVKPDSDSAAYTLFLPGEVIDGAGWNQESEAGIGESPVMFLKQLPRSTTDSITQENLVAKHQDQTDGDQEQFLDHVTLPEATAEAPQGWTIRQSEKKDSSDRQS